MNDRIRQILLVALAVILPAFFAARAHAVDWDLGMLVTVPYALGEGGQATQVVTAGVRLTALDGFDNTWDTVTFNSSTVLLAYSYHPEFAPAHQYLARDVRFDSYPKQWDLFVASDQDGQPVTIEWQLPQVTGGSCLGVEFSVNDVTGGTAVDLSQLNYSYTNNAAVTRQFQLSAAQVVEAPPPPPLNLFSPRTGTASALLAWSGGNDPAVVGSHVYRRDPGAVEFLRLTVVPTASAKYIDSGLAPGSYTYLVTAVTATGCESIPSNEITVFVSP